MQFDNPMITFDPDVIEHEGAETFDLDPSADAPEIPTWDQFKATVKSNMNPRSFLHGTYYTVLIFGIILFFLEVEFDILGDDRINGVMALILALGIASTVFKSRMDDRVPDPNYIPSPIWRYILFIFFIVAEILLATMGRELILFLPAGVVAGYAGLVGAVNLVVLWQFTQEEFDDYVDTKPDRLTVVFHFGVMTLLTGLMFVLPRIPIPELEFVTTILSVILFIFYSGLFWTYAFYDRATINIVSRMTLSVMIGLVLLPLFLILLDRLTVPIQSNVIVIVNFGLCILGFLTYYARPRLQNLLMME